MTRHIIMAAGSGSRWGNYTGKPKHLIDPLGDCEALLSRLVRQLATLGQSDVLVLGPPEYQPYIGTARLESPEIGDSTEWLGATKFVNTQPHWHPTQRTVLWYGDCWLEDQAVTTIAGSVEHSWLNWCRFGPNPLTGCRWGENFAVSFYPEHHTHYLRAIRIAVEAHRNGQTRRSGGWEIARAFNGARDLTRHQRFPNYCEIGGWSDDFDYGADLDRWQQRWAEASK